MPDAKIVVRKWHYRRPGSTYRYDFWRAYLISGERKVPLHNSYGTDFFDEKWIADRVARWWSERTGIPVEVEE